MSTRSKLQQALEPFLKMEGIRTLKVVIEGEGLSCNEEGILLHDLFRETAHTNNSVFGAQLKASRGLVRVVPFEQFVLWASKSNKPLGVKFRNYYKDQLASFKEMVQEILSEIESEVEKT